MSSGCKCGGSCSCGDNCNCLSGVIAEEMTTQVIIVGVSPMKMNYEGSEMGFGEEGGCKCGSGCSCDPCTC